MLAASRTLALVALTVLALLALCATASACPGCKEAIAGEGEDVSRAGVAFSASVLFMLSMPFLLAAGFGAALYRLYRKQQRLAQVPDFEASEEACEEPILTHS